MKRHKRYAGSGIKLALLLIALGCLLAGGLASAIFQPTSAAQDDSLQLDPKSRHSAPDSVSPPATFVADLTQALHPLAKDQSGKFSASPHPVGHVIESDGGQIVCRDATEEETRVMRQRDPEPQLRAINHEESSALSPAQSQDGMKIILRGTPQLEQTPAAKAAFIRAAQRWEAVIQSPITVVIDVDYGPTRFGEPFGQVLGSTDVQWIGSNTAYPGLRSALIGRASNAQEVSLYNSLPQSQIPTDIGATTSMFGASAVFRALGLINPVANPDGENQQLGPPPSVGFNSAYQFDFDPSDGIEPGKTDFDAVATHEIGHALGLSSNAGLKEVAPSVSVAPSPWDLFRFRPGVTSSSFSTAQRIQSSGGEQVFFGGGPELALSTGRPNGSGGDGRHPSHWKDDDLTGRYIGIMDPTLPSGVREEITENDLRALDLMGYKLKSNPNPNPTPSPNQQAVELKLDDGTADIGALLNGLMIVNRFTPPSYPATLQKIRFFFPRFQNQPDPTGKPVSVVVFADPSGAGQPPAGAQIGRLNTTVPGTSPTEFFELILPNGPTISSGDFYIGFQAPSPHQGVGFGVDTSGQSPNRSFFSTNDGASFASLAPALQVNSANAMIRAVVSTGGPAPTPTPTPQPGGNTIALTSGVPQNGSIPAPQPGGGLVGETQYTIRVPNGATQLKVDLSGNTDVDLHVRFGNRIVVQNGAIVADFKSETTTNNESIIITPNGSPALQAGAYYIAVANWGSGPASFTVTATVTGGGGPGPTPTPSPGGNTVALTSGAPRTGAIPAPQPGGGLIGETQYTIQVPNGATQLKVDLSGNPDVDLYARFGNRIVVQNGAIVADFKSETSTGNESITVTPGGSPALQAGLYYLAVGNFGPGAANFTVTATVTGGGGGNCSFTISPTSRNLPSAGGLGNVNVTTSAGCNWTATSNANFINILPPASGSGNGSITYSVGANTGANSRTGTLTVAGQTFTLTQEGSGNPQPGNRVVRVGQAGGSPGGQVSVPIELVAQGDENALGFSLTFDPAVLGNPQAALGSDASGATLNPNTSQVASGRLGLALSLPFGQKFSAGARQIVVVTFTIASGASASSTQVGFGDQPIAREISDVSARALQASYTPGAVTIGATGYEGDVAPRPNGNGSVTITDWVQIGRFVAGQDAPSGGEFQRADTAPRDSRGNGSLTITDWVQAGRYAAGLDAPTPAGGPATPGRQGLMSKSRYAPAGAAMNARVVRVSSGYFERGQQSSVIIELDAEGNENALGFSLDFNPAQLRFVSAAVGREATGATLNVNTSQASKGRIGVALALPAGQTIPAGQRQIIVINFAVAAEGEATTATIGFGDQPVTRELSDASANSLPVNFNGGAVTLARSVTSVSAASFTAQSLAGEAIVAAFGRNLATQLAVAETLPLPTTLAGTTVKVRDSAGVERLAPLFFVAPSQINYQIPEGTAPGEATVTITSGDGQVSTGALSIADVAPGLFSAESSGQGVAAAVVLRVKANGAESYEPVARYDAAQQRFVALPIDLGEEGDQVYLIAYGTGFRHQRDLGAVTVRLGDVETAPLFAGGLPDFAGLDQLNLRIPRSLAGRGEVDVALNAYGHESNRVKVHIR
jgi:uncharacterized protein (TIGR03437 family)